MSGDVVMSPDQVKNRLATLHGWEIAEGKKLVKIFPFGNFVEAVAFVDRLTPVAEKQGHHPDLLVRWGEVRVELWTHSAGGLTAADFDLAGALDGVATAA